MRTVEHRLKSSAENSIEIPLSLNRIEERTLERYKTHLRIKRAKSFSLSFIGVLLFLFYSANSTLSFAQNMKSVPLLSELLEVFRFEDESKDAVQEIGMILSNEKSEVHLQYVLSDAKRLILYFQFPEGITLNDHDLIELKVLEAYDARTNENISEFFHPASYQFAGSFEEDIRYLSLNGALPPDSEETLPENLGMRIHIEVQRRTFDQKIEITEVLDLGDFHHRFMRGAAAGIGAEEVATACALAEAVDKADAPPLLERARTALEAALADVAAYRHELMLRGLKG